MAKTTTIKYDHQELAALMVKDQGIKEGHWMIQAHFSFAVSNVAGPKDGPSGPGTISVLTNLGIQQAAEPGPFTVDAATLWKKAPARSRRRKSKKA